MASPYLARSRGDAELAIPGGYDKMFAHQQTGMSFWLPT
jgi:hypothetical protein